MTSEPEVKEELPLQEQARKNLDIRDVAYLISNILAVKYGAGIKYTLSVYNGSNLDEMSLASSSDTSQLGAVVDMTKIKASELLVAQAKMKEEALKKEEAAATQQRAESQEIELTDREKKI